MCLILYRIAIILLCCFSILVWVLVLIDGRFGGVLFGFGRVDFLLVGWIGGWGFE